MFTVAAGRSAKTFMDVRCERCKTEYEFDEARITEAGVTVKCTTCGHVFKVKKKSAAAEPPPVATVDVDFSAPPTNAGVERQREWKVRQANGNVFTFKELTTLQKWIVERKVVRDDEISLTGESWKRLGNIAELASFFQVVEEAQRAATLEAQAQANAQAQAQALAQAQQAAAAAPRPYTRPGPGTPKPPAAVAPGPTRPPARAPTSPAFPAANGRVNKIGTEPAFARDPLSRPLQHSPPPEDDAKAVQGNGFAKGLIGLFVLLALGAGGYFGYFKWWLPQQEEKAAVERAAAEEKAREEAEAKAAAEKAAAEAAKPAVEVDAGVAVAAVEKPPVAEKPDAGAVKVAKPEPAHDFDYYMERGDRMRERDQPSAALDAYGKASDLDGDRAEPVAGKGLALLDMGNIAAAEASFKQSLKLNGRYGVAIIGLAELYRSEGKKDLAIEFYEKYLESAPNGADAPAARAALKKLKE